MKNLKFFSYFLITIILALGLSISFQSLLAAWTAPADLPPTCASGNPGCDAPINSSNTAQSKSGMLLVNSGGSANGLIVQSGNVGIGMTSPSAKLHIQGVESESSGTFEALVKFNTSNGLVGQLYRDNNGTNNYLGMESFSVGNTVKTPIVFQEWGGNVGIGTTSPSNILDIYTTTDPNARGLSLNGKEALETSGAGDTWLRLNNQNSFTSGVYTPGNLVADGGFSTAWSIAPPADGAYFGGYVGIGMTSPSAKLHIQGVESESSGTFEALVRFNTSNGLVGQLYRDNNGTNNYLGMESFNVGNTVKTPIVFQEWGGNVGIGKNNPSNILDIATTNSTNASGLSLNGKAALTTNDAADTWLRLNNSSSFTSGVYTPGNLVADGGFSTAWSIAPPADGAYFGGSISLGGSANWKGIYNNTSPADGPWIEFIGKDYTTAPLRKGELNMGSYVSGKIKFFNYTGASWTELMTILPSGNTGIGNPSPAYKLDVNGAIRSLGGDIIAESNTWGTDPSYSKWRDDGYGWPAGLVMQCPDGSYMVGIAGTQNDQNNDDINLVSTIFCRKL